MQITTDNENIIDNAGSKQFLFGPSITSAAVCIMTTIYNTLARLGKRDNILVSGPITIFTLELTLFCLFVDVSIIHYPQAFPFCTISARIFI